VILIPRIYIIKSGRMGSEGIAFPLLLATLNAFGIIRSPGRLECKI
jgi:hypothetical protein